MVNVVFEAVVCGVMVATPDRRRFSLIPRQSFSLLLFMKYGFNWLVGRMPPPGRPRVAVVVVAVILIQLL